MRHIFTLVVCALSSFSFAGDGAGNGAGGGGGGKGARGVVGGGGCRKG